MPGVVAYALVSRGVRRRLPFWALNLVLLFAWCAYSVLGNRSQTAGAYLSCLVVGLCIPFALDSQRQILNTISETVAKYSYGIYLVHAPVLALSFALPLPAAVKLAIFAAASGALSYLAYRFIEDPLVQFGKTVTEPVAAARVAI
jgi:peptidoglycan/LPS O-acetylase OafA/YrhL